MKRLLTTLVATTALLVGPSAGAQADYQAGYAQLFNQSGSNRNLTWDFTYPAVSPLGSIAPGDPVHRHAGSFYAPCSGYTKYYVSDGGGWVGVSCRWVDLRSGVIYWVETRS